MEDRHKCATEDVGRDIVYTRLGNSCDNEYGRKLKCTILLKSNIDTLSNI